MVKLCINDYSTTDTSKRQALLSLVQGMLARGVPVDCVGHQMHINVDSPSVAAIGTTIETFAALGLDDYEIAKKSASASTPTTAWQLPGGVTPRGWPEAGLPLPRHLQRVPPVSSVKLIVFGLADDNTWLKSFQSRLDLLPVRPGG